MGWYVSRNGETSGPVDDAQIVKWIRAGMRDASVRDEAGGGWLPLAKSPFARVVKDQGVTVNQVVIVLAVGIALVLGLLSLAK